MSRFTWNRLSKGALLVVLLALTILTSSSPASGQSKESKVDKTTAPDKKDVPPDDKNKKKDKRGSLVIAPIPISSPAFGSGLLLITGYVFKLNESDQVSPPSWLGGAGAFTNNGSRALALGGRLYLQENKYQTTFAAMRGRANLDFFGIGRIPFRSDQLLPAGGVGLRFKLDKKNHINYRIDLAFGREGRTIAIGLGEAF